MDEIARSKREAKPIWAVRQLDLAWASGYCSRLFAGLDGAWLSLVERKLWELDVVGSNPTAPIAPEETADSGMDGAVGGRGIWCSVEMTTDANRSGEEDGAISGEWPITGTLDLHLFRPGEAGDLVPEYLEECRARGILRVRIIHGKGTGQLRERVHAILRRMPGVETFGLAPEQLGGWGATTVELRP